MKKFVFDLQRFDDSKSSLGGLTLLNSVMVTLRLGDLIREVKDDPIGSLKSNANPILKFIGTYLEEITKGKSDEKKKIMGFANILASGISIIDSAVKISKHAEEKESAKDAKEKETHALEITKESDLIVSELANVTNEIVKLSTGEKSFVLSITASAISLVANGITALDGVTEEEKNKINVSYLGFMKELNKDLIKKLFNSAIETELNKIDLDDVTHNINILKNTKILDNVSETLTKAGGVLDLVFAAAEGVLNGINKYKATFKKYTEDGIPEDLAKRDAFINAFTAVIHDTAHAYTKGLDDVLYNGAKALIWAITGKEGIQGNYVEVMTEMFKTFNYTNTGSEDGDFLVSYIHDTMIYGAGGDDYIGNIASNVQIFGGHDNDTIISRLGDGNDYSTPQGNSILGGPGRDLIMAYDTNSTILGGTDNDKLFILGTKNKLYGEDGVDFFYLQEGADSNTINGGLGDDVVILESVQNEVIEYNEGDGNDIVLGYDESDVIKITGNYSTQTSGQDVIIGVGNDSITLSGAAGKEININGTKQVIGTKPTNPPLIITLPSIWHEDVKVIRGTNDRNFINNTLDNVIIEAFAGDDHINNYCASVSIDVGAGNDYIENGGDSVSINCGAGSDTINNNCRYRWNDKTQRYETISSPDNVTIDGGVGNDSIMNNGSESVSISGGADSDTVRNYGGNDITIDGGVGNDTIINYDGDSVSISGGAGDDSIYNDYESAFVTIDGGVGNDTIINIDGSNVMIDGGAGNDTIYNDGDNVTIDGGTDNDYIWNYGDNATIDGGAGNDTIYNDGDNATIDGGNGDDEIILYTENNVVEYSAGDGNDTIWGFNETSTLSISGGKYTRSSFGNDVIITVGDGFILLKNPKGKTLNIDGEEAVDEPVWTLDGTTATYGTENKTLITISGVNSLKGISLSGKTVTVSAASLNKSSGVTISGDGYTLALANDVPTSSINAARWTLNGTTATYKNSTTTAGYSCDGKNISYMSAVGGETLITVKGVKSLDGISLSDKAVTVSKASIGTGTISISKGYSLELADDVPTPEQGAETWSVSGTKAKLTVGTSAGYTCDGSTITYAKASTGKTLATVSGLKSGLKATNGKIDGLTLDGTRITLSAKVLGTSKVTVSKGYTLELASDVPTPEQGAETWSVSGTKAKLTVGTSAGYTCDGSTITYAKASTGKTLATVSGLKSGLKATNGKINGLTLNGTEITLSAKVLGTSKVTVNKGYTLELADDVSAPKTGKAAWSVSGTKAKLTVGTSAGYTCDGSTITYAKASTGKTLATVSGLKSGLKATNGKINGLTLNGTRITLSAKVLGTSKVTVSKGYTLALASDVSAPKAGKAAWSVSGTTAKLTVGTSAGYTCNGSTITYAKASTSKTLATVSGLKSGLRATNGKINGLTLNGTRITLSAKVLGTSKVTVSKGYTLELADDVPTPEQGAETWNVSGTKAKLIVGTSAGYTCDGSTITYAKASTGKTLATVSGLKSGLKATNGKINGLTLDDNTVTLSAKVIGNKVSVSGSCEFDFTENCSKVSITGSKDNDSIQVFGSANTITGGKGNDTITSSGDKNLFIYSSGDGNDVIVDFTSNDKIKIAKGTPKVSIGGNDVIVTVDKGSIVLADAAGQTIILLDSKNKMDIYSTKSAYLLSDTNYDTDTRLGTLADIRDANDPLGTISNINEVGNSFGTSDIFSNEKTYFATYSDKK